MPGEKLLQNMWQITQTELKRKKLQMLIMFHSINFYFVDFSKLWAAPRNIWLRFSFSKASYVLQNFIVK